MEAKQRSLFSLIAYDFFLWFLSYISLFILCFRSRGGILVEQEGDGDVGEELDGIDFDGLEAMANEGRV